MSHDNQQYIASALASGEFTSRDQLIDAAVTLLRDQTETVAALREAIATADQGAGVPLKSFVAVRRRSIPFDAGTIN